MKKEKINDLIENVIIILVLLSVTVNCTICFTAISLWTVKDGLLSQVAIALTLCLFSFIPCVIAIKFAVEHGNK